MSDIAYSFITPSVGKRPIALGLAIDSVFKAAEVAGIPAECIELLIGFDGVKGERVRQHPSIKWYDFPSNNDFGNAIRDGLLKAAKGKRVMFLDDDNTLTPTALQTFNAYPEADMIVARIDVSKAHQVAYLPIEEEGKELIRHCNIDPLCLAFSRDLVVNACQGWLGEKYEADFKNIVRYSRRARNIAISHDIVGIYDSGRGLDSEGLNFRQKKLPPLS